MSLFSFVRTAFRILTKRGNSVDQYTSLLTSREYANFISENREYAELCGYSVGTERGMTEAMADQFLFQQFLDEQTMDA